MNLYQKIMDTLIEKNSIDGEMPAWLEKIKTIFEWGKHFGIIVEKAHNGELANDLADIIPHELVVNFISIDESMLLWSIDLNETEFSFDK